MKDNWKEKLDFNFLQDGIIRVTIDNKEIKSIVELYLFIESLLAEQKKEMMEEVSSWIAEGCAETDTMVDLAKFLRKKLNHHD